MASTAGSKYEPTRLPRTSGDELGRRSRFNREARHPHDAELFGVHGSIGLEPFDIETAMPARRDQRVNESTAS